EAIYGVLRVHAGQVLVIRRPAPEEPPVLLDYEVVHRDEHLLVLDKPGNLPVHPSARYHRHTLTALLRRRLGPGHGWEMAHRLDRETSGVMVFGRRKSSGPALKGSFYRREVEAVLQNDAVIVTSTLTEEGWLADGRMPGAEEPGTPAEVYNTNVQNLTGLPAVTVPAGRMPNGVPFGIQFTGPPLSDRRLLDLAAAWERVRPWPRAADGYEPFGV
ncbi:MAG TPA: pseudouridine synthase, partial [Actinomycetota bacterium]|nr:pseudouridine synthase [Actinomycetota bacterium]